MRADWQLVRDCLSGKVEVQTCPRRSESSRPIRTSADRWDRTRWGSSLGRRWERFWHGNRDSRAYRVLAWVYKKLGRGIPYLGGTRWQWPWYPRDCSYCGGVHPEDAIRLIEEGWESERAKSYKFYLNPPGYHAVMRAAYQTMRERRSVAPPSRYVWSPVPPVKLYTMHFSEDQILRYNSAVKHRREMSERDKHVREGW